MYSKSKLIFRFVKQIRSIILIPLSIFPLLNSYRGLSSMKKYYKIKENINGKHDKRIRSLQFPVSKSLDKHSQVKKTPNNYPTENEIANIAMNFPLFLLGVISAKIVQANGAKNPINKDDT